jgi:uncharacterized membrane protein (DUF373 family)
MDKKNVEHRMLIVGILIFFSIFFLFIIRNYDTINNILSLYPYKSLKYLLNKFLFLLISCKMI